MAEEDREPCPDCDNGIRHVPLYNDFDEIEGWMDVRCSFCGGVGSFPADQAAELKAEGVWYDNPSYY